MTKNISMLCAGLLLLCTGARAGAPAPQKSVQGELIDLQCYDGDGPSARGAAHRECALKCAAMGVPVGVLDASGHVTVLAVVPGQVSAQMARVVRATGVEKDGVLVPTAIQVQSGAAWNDLKF